MTKVAIVVVVNGSLASKVIHGSSNYVVYGSTTRALLEHSTGRIIIIDHLGQR